MNYFIILLFFCLGISIFIIGNFLRTSTYSVICIVIGIIIVGNVFWFVKMICNPEKYNCTNVYPKERQKYRKYYSDSYLIG
jgi:hypothetical protein